MARVLGANGYGALAGSVALFMACGQLTGLGSGIALTRHVSLGGELRSRFWATERAYFFSGLALAALMWPLSIYILGQSVPIPLLGYLAVAEILVAPSLQPLVYRYQGEERIFLSSAIGTLAPMVRLAAVIIMLAMNLHDPVAFSQIYLIGLTLAAGTILLVTWPRDDRTSYSFCSPIQAMREGLPYAVSGVTLTASSELDKTVLLRLAGDVATGPYAAAYRIASAATLPVNALIQAASPRLFRSSNSGTSRLTVIMLLSVICYAFFAAVALWLLAPSIARLLGHGFDGTAQLLRALCVIIVTGSLRQHISALLTTRNLQKRRNLTEIGGMCVSLVLLIILVPKFGPYGAISALVMSDIFFILVGSTQTNPPAKDAAK